MWQQLVLASGFESNDFRDSGFLVGTGLLISMQGTLNLCHLIVQYNQQYWCNSILDWNSYIVSVDKTASKQIGAMICFVMFGISKNVLNKSVI